jgi:hypothetical protein
VGPAEHEDEDARGRLEPHGELELAERAALRLQLRRFEGESRSVRPDRHQPRRRAVDPRGRRAAGRTSAPAAIVSDRRTSCRSIS